LAHELIRTEFSDWRRSRNGVAATSLAFLLGQDFIVAHVPCCGDAGTLWKRLLLWLWSGRFLKLKNIIVCAALHKYVGIM